jgi:predicted metal-dependent phosphoesterase TrpH
VAGRNVRRNGGLPVIVDLHVHASERSGCSIAGEEELIRAAIDYGLDGLAFTDHHRLVGEERIEELNLRYAPFRVFGGVEVSLVGGEDVLVYGVNEPALEAANWNYPELFRLVRSRGGFVTLAHPFRYSDSIAIDIERYPPDAVETRSVHIDSRQAAMIRRTLATRPLAPVFNSDAHRVEHVGLYCNDLERAVTTMGQLIEELKAGRYRFHADRHRIAAHNQTLDRERRLPLLATPGRPA